MHLHGAECCEPHLHHLAQLTYATDAQDSKATPVGMTKFEHDHDNDNGNGKQL